MEWQKRIPILAAKFTQFACIISFSAPLMQSSLVKYPEFVKIEVMTLIA